MCYKLWLHYWLCTALGWLSQWFSLNRNVFTKRWKPARFLTRSPINGRRLVLISLPKRDGGLSIHGDKRGIIPERDIVVRPCAVSYIFHNLVNLIFTLYFCVRYTGFQNRSCWFAFNAAAATKPPQARRGTRKKYGYQTRNRDDCGDYEKWSCTMMIKQLFTPDMQFLG